MNREEQFEYRDLVQRLTELGHLDLALILEDRRFTKFYLQELEKEGHEILQLIKQRKHA